MKKDKWNPEKEEHVENEQTAFVVAVEKDGKLEYAYYHQVLGAPSTTKKLSEADRFDTFEEAKEYIPTVVSSFERDFSAKVHQVDIYDRGEVASWGVEEKAFVVAVTEEGHPTKYVNKREGVWAKEIALAEIYTIKEDARESGQTLKNSLSEEFGVEIHQIGLENRGVVEKILSRHPSSAALEKIAEEMNNELLNDPNFVTLVVSVPNTILLFYKDPSKVKEKPKIPITNANVNLFIRKLNLPKKK